MSRAGEDYDLIIRSRFDLLLPEPLNLHRIFTVTEENDGRVSEVVSSPTLDSGNGIDALRYAFGFCTLFVLQYAHGI